MNITSLKVAIITVHLILFGFYSPYLLAKKMTIHIEIINHFFVPDKITIPADIKVRIIIHNRDKTPEEFESYELNREKIIMGEKKVKIFIGPLPVGKYPFFGEFNQKTAKGVIIVK